MPYKVASFTTLQSGVETSRSVANISGASL